MDPLSTGRKHEAKLLGAYYTDSQVADFLVRWAIRSGHDTVLDPCFGGGVFLRSACVRLRELGGLPAKQVWGVELDPVVYSRIAEKLCDEFSIRQSQLHLSDFFELLPEHHSVDAVVGNPPFIRYQRFNGQSRYRALKHSAQQGVHFPELTSSWAPFVVQSSTMLCKGGRLAMVVPFEIMHAGYAKPLLAFLHDTFERVTFLTFQKRLFPDLSEDTMLLLADGKGQEHQGFFHRDFEHPGQLSTVLEEETRPLLNATHVQAEGLVNAGERLIEHFISRKARDLYRELRHNAAVQNLGSVANVGIGYVTGANDFFHIGPGDQQRWQIPNEYLRPALRRGRALHGLNFTKSDWCGGLSDGGTSNLLHIQGDTKLPPSIKAYLEHGERLGVPAAYKCRARKVWYQVPHVYLPHAFLTYMSGRTSRLVVNEAEAVAPNTLHIVRLHAGTQHTPIQLATHWRTALTALSVEIEGHPLGGGMLKLEPTEAERVLLPSTSLSSNECRSLAIELDKLERAGRLDEAERIADRVLLCEQFGLGSQERELLREAAVTLRARRQPSGARR